MGKKKPKDVKLTESDETEVLPEAMLFNLRIIFIIIDSSNPNNATQSTT